MKCIHCNKNEAVKTHEGIEDGKKTVKYYCLDCYDRLFLDSPLSEGNEFSACPYCGTTVAEYEKTKIVGCAYCYQTLQKELTPSIIKMQGEIGHRGKTPFTEDASPVQKNSEEIDKLRFERQCRELDLIIKKLAKEKNFDDAKEYADKLSRMKSKSGIEEEFVWRKRRNSSKRS